MSANHKKSKKTQSEEFENTEIDAEEEDIIIKMTDEEGNVFLYEEEMIIPVDDKKFALLVALPYEGHEHGCDCGCEEDDIIIAKIVTNEQGEEEYIEPTDEEFEIVKQAYNDFFADEDSDKEE